MHNAPIVQLPKQKHNLNLSIILIAVAMLVIAILLVVMLASPGVNSNAPAMNIYANPELRLFENYRAGRMTTGSAAVSENPELSAFNRYVVTQSGEPSLYENPEVGQYQRWLESR